MATNRKDNRGRVLKTGESQRKDLLYQFRYTDCYGKRRTIYDSNLDNLRKKEKEIQRQLDDGIDYVRGDITVIKLVERYIGLKQGVRYNTKVGYNFVLNILKNDKFGQRKINTIRVSDAKKWFIDLHFNEQRGYSSIRNIRGVVKPAFEMAYQEDIIRRNPFDFKLDIIPNNSQRRVAMTSEQVDIFMEYVANDNHFRQYYDEYVILLETGLRISELAGLTLKDIDFDNRKIRVSHQLQRTRIGVTGKTEYYIEETKTENGIRYIPMSDRAYVSLKNVIRNRKKLKKEIIIDGYTGFLFLDRNDNPKVAMHFEHQMKRVLDKYNRENPNNQLPKITPHVFRHTFCTNLANGGMPIKSLEYVMGHGDISTTMNVYTHARYENVEESMGKILKFSEAVNKLKRA
ncbi:MAG: site-specific integrase [Lachnospiraceae bacterium]|nr:site-specific integrase [Lachnospiraceae bacterium]